MSEWELFDGTKEHAAQTEAWVVEAISRGLKPTVLVRRVGETEWRSLRSHAPFAAALEQQNAKAPMPLTAPTTTPPAPAITPLGKMVLIAIGATLMLLAVFFGWLQRAKSKTTEAQAPKVTAQSPQTNKQGYGVTTADIDVSRNGTPAARAVWANFDKLPQQQRTKEALGASFIEANGSNPSILLRNYNKAQMRIRITPMLSPGGYVEGDDFDFMVPSANEKECFAWVAKYLDQEMKDRMLDMYYSGVRCYATGPNGGKTMTREYQIP